MGDYPRRLPWHECLVLVALVAGVALVMALSLHHYCTHAPAAVDAPVPGTPRANYCETADSGHPWALTLLAAGLACAVVFATRRRSALVVWSCVLIAIVTAILAGLAGGLDYNYSL